MCYKYWLNMIKTKKATKSLKAGILQMAHIYTWTTEALTTVVIWANTEKEPREAFS